MNHSRYFLLQNNIDFAPRKFCKHIIVNVVRKVHCLGASLTGAVPVGSFRETGWGGLLGSGAYGAQGYGAWGSIKRRRLGDNKFASQFLFTSFAGVWPNCRKFARFSAARFTIGRSTNSISFLFYKTKLLKNLQTTIWHGKSRQNVSFKRIGIDSVG